MAEVPAIIPERRLVGFDAAYEQREKALSSVSGSSRGGWWPIVHESFPGAWQQNVEVNYNQVLAYHAVFACMTLIASDISKLRLKLVQRVDGIWTEIEPVSPVFRNPNPYQNRIQFWESWILSKLSRGNTYGLKVRDERGFVVAIYILDPNRTTPLVADDGSVFYQLQTDNLSGVDGQVTVPAREIIHDRFNCLFHPLVGISPLYACGLAAMQGLKIQDNSTTFFANRAVPAGVLTAPNAIGDDTAARLKAHWETNFAGANAGKIAVLGDGLKFEPMTMTAEDAQLIDQLKLTAEIICSTFHVPPYKIGIGPMPSYNNIQALNVEYYSQCLQSHIESAEAALDNGLEFGPNLGVEFDLDGLLRMDSVTQMTVIDTGIKGGWLKPNEGRAKMDLQPVEGGDTPYMQQQQFSLAALAQRDRDKPFAKPEPPAAATPAEPEPDEDGNDERDRSYADTLLNRAYFFDEDQVPA